MELHCHQVRSLCYNDNIAGCDRGKYRKWSPSFYTYSYFGHVYLKIDGEM